MPNALVLRNDAKQTRSAFIFCVLPLRPAHSQAPQCSSRKHSWPQMELVWSFLEALHDQRRRVSGRGARESICSAWLWERCSVTQVCTVCTRASWAHAAKNTKNIRYTFSVDGFSPFFFFWVLFFPLHKVATEIRVCVYKLAFYVLLSKSEKGVVYLFRLTCNSVFRI